MLQVLINGVQAVLPLDFKILLQRYSPLLDFEGVRGARSLNFKLPYCDVNNAIFKFYGNRNIPYQFVDYRCEYLYKGRSVQRGYLRLVRVSYDGFEVIFTEYLSNLFGQFDSFSLQELDFGTINIPSPPVAAADKDIDPFCWPMVRNDQFYGNQNTGFGGYVNKYLSPSYEEGPKVPHFFLTWVFGKITELTGVKFTGSFFENEAVKELIFYNTKCLDGLTVIDTALHLPQLSIRDLIKELRKLFNLAVWPNVWKKEIQIDFVDDYLAGNVRSDWSSKFAKLKGKDPLIENRLKLDWKVDSGDGMTKEIPTAMAGYLSPSENEIPGIFSVSTLFSTLSMQNGLPIAEQQGISTLNGQNNNSFSPRLLFWRGVVDGIPLASTTASNGVELNWNSANGLKNTFWNKYEKFRLNTHIVTEQGNLNAYDLAVIDSHRRGGELVKVHIQGYNYIIGNQQITLPSAVLPRLELWKV